MADALAQACRSFKRDQRTPAVADQRGARYAGGIQQRGNEVSRRLDTGRRFAAAAAMAGQIDGQHVPAVVRQKTALQDPNAVVIEHTVNEDSGGLGSVKGLAAGVAVGGGAQNAELHAEAPVVAFSAAFKARFRSSIKSSGSSRPMLRRMVPWVMPPATSASSLMRKCVVLAG